MTRPFFAQLIEADERLPARIRERREAVTAAARLADLRGTADKVIGSLRSISAPQDVGDLHGRLIAVFQRMRDHIADGGAAADSANNRVYRAVPRQLRQDSAALDALAPEFRSRGYRRLGF